MKRTLLGLAIACGAIALGGCESPLQDQGSTAYSFSGTVIDPYLQNALVYPDFNNNGEMDVAERRFAQRTDADGNFSGLKIPDRMLEGGSSVILRSVEGYDAWTGQPASGQLMMSVSAAQANDSAVLSPMSSLLVYSEADSQLQQLLDGLDYDVSADFLSHEQANADVAAHSLKVHKTLGIIASAIVASMADEDQDVDDVDIDEAMAMDALYQALATGDDGLSLDSVQLTTLAEDAVALLSRGSDTRRARAFDVSGVLNALRTSGTLSVAAQTAVALNAIMIRELSSEHLVQSLKAKSRLVEVVNLKVRETVDAEMEKLHGGVPKAKDSAAITAELVELERKLNSNELDGLFVNLTPADAGTEVDLSVLHDIDFSTATAEAITELDLALSDTAKLDPRLGGDDYLLFELSEQDDEQEYGLAAIFGPGTATNGVSGSLSLCFYLDDGDDTQDSQEETDGMLIADGRWSKLASNRLLFSFSFAGYELSPVLVLKGADPEVPSQYVYGLELDLDIDMEDMEMPDEWKSDTQPNAFTIISADEAPDSDLDCQQTLAR